MLKRLLLINSLMNFVIAGGIVAAAILLISLSTIPLAAVSASEKSETNKLLSQLRKVTAQYHDPEKAIADGYQPTDVCVLGMGYHYVNFGLASDLNIDELQPEVIIFEPSADGSVRLVAAEYFVVALANTETGPVPWFGESPPPLGWFNAAPVIFEDQTFEGPMPGHEPGMPWHYDLHAWVWKHNPDGMFASFNPNVSCE